MDLFENYFYKILIYLIDSEDNTFNNISVEDNESIDDEIVDDSSIIDDLESKTE